VADETPDPTVPPEVAATSQPAEAPAAGTAAGATAAPSALDELGSVDVDGVAAATWGSAVWAVALIVTLVLRDRLAESGSQWWIAVCAVALVGGLLGRWYAMTRRTAYRQAAAAAAAAAPERGA
jgi:hypothetical protein